MQLTLDDRARLLVDLAPPRVVLGAELEALPPPAGAGDARLAEDVAAAAVRRGTASAKAGKLWEEGASDERIATAAAREHDERVRFVEIARRLGLTDCAEVLSAADRRAITETIERGLASPSARERCETLGERLLDERYNGAVARCGRNEGPGIRAESAEVLALQGMDEVFATAQVRLTGPDAPDRVRVRIAFEDGAYRIDKLD